MTGAVVRLGDVVDNFDSLRRPVKVADRAEGPVPYYGASGIIDRVAGKTHSGQYLLIAEDGENLRSRTTPIAFLADGDFWANNHVHVVRGNARADTRFLSYVVNSLDIAPYLTGSTLPKLNRSAMDSIEFHLPTLAGQQAIAEVLGALDDKIAVNSRIAVKAGELAALAYRSALSRCTVQRLPFGDVASIGGGGTPRTSEARYWAGGIPWATPTDVTALSGPYIVRTERTITEDGLAACASALYPAGSILMTSRATIGAFAIAQRPMAVNQGFIVVRPNDEATLWWIFHDMRSRVDEFINFANGATFLELTRGRFRQLEARLGGEREMREFGSRASSLHGLACQVLQESETLAQLRDTLLPHLMSGRLRVRDAEKQVGEVI